MDGASLNTVCYALKGDSRDQGQIPQVEYKVSRHWAANNDVSLREALREQYVRSELQWSDGGQLCWQVITFEWVLREEDGEMVVVPSLPVVEKWETDAAQAHMPSRHQMGLPDPPSYMRFDMNRLVDLYFNEPMPDWLFAGMGVLGSKHLQRYMMKRNERRGIPPVQHEPRIPIQDWYFPEEESEAVQTQLASRESPTPMTQPLDTAHAPAWSDLTFAEKWTAARGTTVPGAPYAYIDPSCLTMLDPPTWRQQYPG